MSQTRGLQASPRWAPLTIAAAVLGVALATGVTLGGAANWFGFLLVVASLAPFLAADWLWAVGLRGVASLLFLALAVLAGFTVGVLVVLPFLLEFGAFVGAIEQRRLAEVWGG